MIIVTIHLGFSCQKVHIPEQIINISNEYLYANSITDNILREMITFKIIW